MNQKMGSLPEGLEEFILSQFQTVTQLEVLCYLFQHKGISFPADSVRQLLFLSETLTLQTLGRLKELGYVSEENNSFRYIESNSPEIEKYFEIISRLLASRKSLLVELLFNSFMKGES